jgi:HlyD family secretion protein
MSSEGARIIDVQNVKPYKSPRQKKQVLIAVVVVVIAAGLGVGAWFLLSPHKQAYTLRAYDTATVTKAALVQSTQASGTVAIPVQMSLPSPEEGYAATLSVAEGDTVKKGQVLARLDVPTLQNDLQDLQSTLTEAKRTYDRTVASNRIDLDRKAREITSAASDIADQQAEVDRIGKLVAINDSRQSDLDTAKKNLASLTAARKEKELQLEEQKQLDAMDEAAAQAKIADLQVQVQRLKDRIAAMTIISPMAGEVLAANAALGVPGSLVTNGASLFTVADPASAIVELEVLEQYSTLLTVGKQVTLTIGSATLTGHITSIGKVATQSSDGLGATVEVKVKPDGSSTNLLEGNTAVGTIDLGTTQGALLLPRGPYLTTGSERYLYKVVGTTARRIAVTFGSTEGSNVQILSGVSEGDTIITSGYQNFIEYDQVILAKGDTK